MARPLLTETMLFIQTYGTTLVGNGWNLVTNHSLFILIYICCTSKEFLGAMDTFQQKMDVGYIVDLYGQW
jgi:hypothetical protein